MLLRCDAGTRESGHLSPLSRHEKAMAAGRSLPKLPSPLPSMQQAQAKAQFRGHSLGRRSAPRQSCASFAKLRFDKNQAKRPGSSLRPDKLQRVCLLFGGHTCVIFTRSTEARTQELRLLCPLLADRTQERRQADGARSDVVMSHVVDRRQESGQGQYRRDLTRSRSRTRIPSVISPGEGS